MRRKNTTIISTILMDFTSMDLILAVAKIKYNYYLTFNVWHKIKYKSVKIIELKLMEFTNNNNSL